MQISIYRWMTYFVVLYHTAITTWYNDTMTTVKFYSISSVIQMIRKSICIKSIVTLPLQPPSDKQRNCHHIPLFLCSSRMKHYSLSQGLKSDCLGLTSGFLLAEWLCASYLTSVESVFWSEKWGNNSIESILQIRRNKWNNICKKVRRAFRTAHSKQ